MIRIIYLIIYSILFISFYTGAHSSPQKIFTIGVEDYENWLPYSQFKDGDYSGLGRDILDLFAQHKGYIFKYEVYPLKRRDRMFVEQQLDFSFPDNPNWVPHLKQGIKIEYTPLLKFTDGVMVLPENLGKGLTHLKTLGVPLGFTPYQYLDLINNGKMLSYIYPNYDSLYQKVELKHIDGAYMNIDIAKYYMSQNKELPLTLTFDPDLPHAKGYWHLASIQYPQIIEEFRCFMRDNLQTIKRLKEKYNFSPN